VLQIEVILDHGVSPMWNSLSGAARTGVVAPIFDWFAETVPAADYQSRGIVSDLDVLPQRIEQPSRKTPQDRHQGSVRSMQKNSVNAENQHN
jgi:hypothetical protein